jgi:hypothetical protein
MDGSGVNTRIETLHPSIHSIEDWRGGMDGSGARLEWRENGWFRNE